MVSAYTFRCSENFLVDTDTIPEHCRHLFSCREVSQRTWYEKPALPDNSDVGEIAVLLIPVQTIPDHKIIPDGKTDIISLERNNPALMFIQQ